MEGFRTAQVAKLTGVNPKTLHYWATSGFLRSSVADSQGTGTRRLYSFRDLIALRVAVELRKAGVSLQSLRKVVDFLRRERKLDHPMSEGFLLTDGKQVYLKDGEDLIATLREPGQKLLFQVVDLARTVNELHGAVLQLQKSINQEKEGPRQAV